MNRTHRKLAGLIGIVAVVFTQLAVSAYACPLPFHGEHGAGAPVDAPSVSDVTSQVPDFVSASLCQKHCENEQKNVKDTPQPLASAALESGFITSLAMNPSAPPLLTASTPSLLYARFPTHAIRHCRFRI